MLGALSDGGFGFGLLVASVGSGWALAFDAATYVLAAIFLGRISVLAAPRSETAVGPPPPVALPPTASLKRIQAQVCWLHLSITNPCSIYP